MRPEPSHPPLRVWAYAAAVLAALLVFLGREAGFLPIVRRTQIDALNLPRLNDVPPGAAHVVALGTSKTLYSVEFDESFARRLDATSPPAAFHRITWPGATIDDLEPALEVLRRHPPRVLLLESSLLQFDLGEQLGFRESLQPLEKYLHARLTGDASGDGFYGDNRGHERFISAEACSKTQAPAYRRRYAIRMASIALSPPARLFMQRFAARGPSIELSTPAGRERYLRVLRVLQSSGTRIVLIEQPRASWATAVVPEGVIKENAMVIERIVRDEGFALWMPSVLPPDAYCDEGHLNARGRDIYSAWLAVKLSEILAVPHG